MKFNFKITKKVIISVLLFCITVLTFAVGTQFLKQKAIVSNSHTASSNQYPTSKMVLEKSQESNLKQSLGEKLQPKPQEKPTPQTQTKPETSLPPEIPLTKELSTANTPTPQATQIPTQTPTQTPTETPIQTQAKALSAKALANHPRYLIAWADPTNFGERFTRDVNGNPVNNQPIIVLHETAATASSAINTFRQPNTDENLQVSYHTLISLDGTVIYLVPPEKRAFGAGNSVFQSANGIETVKTNPALPPSVNNFAYHVSLETPADGQGNKNPEHSGYTEAQYESLAWLVSQSSVPDNRITTHRAVDRSGQRVDPRSFDFNKFLTVLHTYR
jgi:cytoskeletal protein RodZ